MVNNMIRFNKIIILLTFFFCGYSTLNGQTYKKQTKAIGDSAYTFVLKKDTIIISKISGIKSLDTLFVFDPDIAAIKVLLKNPKYFFGKDSKFISQADATAEWIIGQYKINDEKKQVEQIKQEFDSRLEGFKDSDTALFIRAHKKIPIYGEPVTFKNNDISKVDVAKIGNAALDTLIIDSITVKFHFACINDISILGHLKSNGEERQFNLQFPVGLKSTSDFDDLKNKKVINNSNNSKSYIKLTDALNFLPKYANRTFNYSPDDGVITFPNNKYSLEKTYPYKRSSANANFRLNVFSDLVGLAVNKPNGLVQTEGIWYFHFLTKPISGTTIRVIRDVAPIFGITKLDQNNRYLAISTDTIQKIRHVNYFNIVQWSNLYVGGMLNILSFDNRKASTSLFINMRLKYFKTSLIDSLNNKKTYDVNGIMYEPEIYWKIFPAENYGLDFSYSAIWLNLFNSGIKLNYDNFDADKKINYTNVQHLSSKPIMKISLMVYYSKKGSSNKVYFRGTAYNTFGGSNNFLQIQIGYSMDITKMLKK